jgi:biopolymer transport protein ExbD
MPRALATIASLALFCVTSAGCDEPAAPTGATTASARPSAATAPPPPPPKPKTMPPLSVDADGPYLGGTRVKLASPADRERLVKVAAELPIEGKPVVLQAEKKAKTPDVAAVVDALGRAGAPKVTIQTDGRDDVPKQVDVTPPSRLSSPPACSVATMVLKDLSTAVWPFAGGLGKRHSKGFAGPDLSHTSESLEKAIAGCESSIALVSGDDTILWEMTYNLAGTLVVADKKKKLDTVVVLAEAPVAGRAVTLSR